MAAKPTNKHPTILRDKATGNAALDAYGYTRWPHLFNVLALKYEVPESLLLTLLFLWDRTVGDGDDCGDIALSQIPVRPREKIKWLTALTASGFFERTVAKPGGVRQRGSFYVYNNVSSNDWDEFFWRAQLLLRFPKWDKVTAPQFGMLFTGIRGERIERQRVGLIFLDMLDQGRNVMRKNDDQPALGFAEELEKA